MPSDLAFQPALRALVGNGSNSSALQVIYMRLIHHPDRKDISLAAVLYALGDPVRLESVRRLATEGELSCSALHGAIAKSTLSHHLRILRESGVIYCRKEGTQHINSLRREDLEVLFPGLLEVVLRSTYPSCQLLKSQNKRSRNRQSFPAS